MKNKIIILLGILICFLSLDVTLAGEQEIYDEIVFVGNDEERLEMEHLLFAKLAYDNLDEYEGKSVAEYVNLCPELYSDEIWEDSGINYTALYSSIVGEWEIYRSYNYNDTSGLYAVAFKKDDKVVLSFRGSEMFPENLALDESNDWLGTDLKFAILNQLSEQFEDADKCYEELLAEIENNGLECDITFSGHSLGGALVSYESIMTDCYGYSFDGAAGHVIDLVYYYCYLDIYDFSGIDKIKFCNYTDETGYVIADMIQHNYAENMYQIDRKTDVDGLNEDSFMIGVLDASSHIIWSYVGHEGNKVFLNDAVYYENTPTDAEYSYEPLIQVCMDIDENIIAYSLEVFDFYFPWNNPSSADIDYEHMLGSLVGANIDGRVVLGATAGQEIWGCKDIGVRGCFGVDLVVYGGEGDDKLYGYTADDVLISNGGNDCLDGNLGNDTYIVDTCQESNLFIRDLGGEKSSIIFRNMSVTDINQLSFDAVNKCLTFDGQSIEIDMCQSYDDINLYCYNETLTKLGLLSELTDDENDVQNSEYKYIVIYEGEGTIKLYNDENEYIYSNVEDNQSEDIYFVSNELGDVYIGNCDGLKTIMLVLNDEYQVEVSNEDERVDMAIGKYSDEAGVFCCKRRYDRNFTEYLVNFSENALDDGVSGDITWSDIFNHDINLMDLFLNIFGIK